MSSYYNFSFFFYMLKNTIIAMSVNRANTTIHFIHPFHTLIYYYFIIYIIFLHSYILLFYYLYNILLNKVVLNKCNK